LAPILDTHAAECASAGSRETSRRQGLPAGNSGQPAIVGTTLPPARGATGRGWGGVSDAKVVGLSGGPIDDLARDAVDRTTVARTADDANADPETVAADVDGSDADADPALGRCGEAEQASAPKITAARTSAPRLPGPGTHASCRTSQSAAPSPVTRVVACRPVTDAHERGTQCAKVVI
jgi:hypothetical protein